MKIVKTIGIIFLVGAAGVFGLYAFFELCPNFNITTGLC